MKKIFVSMALVSSVFCVSLVPGALAVTDSDVNTNRLEVAGDTTFTLTLGSNWTNASFTGFTAYVSNPERTYATDANRYVEVTDYTGIAGHEIDIEWYATTWYYDGSDTLGGNIFDCPNCVISDPDDDEIEFYLGTTGSLKNWTDKDSGLCQADTSTMTQSAGWVTTAGIEFAQNTDSCAGTAKYTTGEIKIVGPLNGFATGSYTKSGVFTLTDGTT